jgi:hypothetical protein
MSELLHNQTKPGSNSRYLFTGNSCFPISPEENKNFTEKDDQIVKTLERFPHMDHKLEFSFLQDKHELKYIKNAAKLQEKKESLNEIFRDSNPNLI